MSLNEIKKECQIPGKGHNETYEIVNPMEHMQTASDVIQGHVPENGGTCNFKILHPSTGAVCLERKWELRKECDINTLNFQNLASVDGIRVLCSLNTRVLGFWWSSGRCVWLSAWNFYCSRQLSSTWSGTCVCWCRMHWIKDVIVTWS
jgi:hypothetical protein